MNIAIEQTEEYVNGQLKNKYGDAFLRGNNGEGFRFTRLSGFCLTLLIMQRRDSLIKLKLLENMKPAKSKAQLQTPSRM